MVQRCLRTRKKGVSSSRHMITTCWKIITNIPLTSGCDVNAPSRAGLASMHTTIHGCRDLLPFLHDTGPSFFGVHTNRGETWLTVFQDRLTFNSVCNQKMPAIIRRCWGPGWVMILRSRWHEAQRRLPGDRGAMGMHNPSKLDRWPLLRSWVLTVNRA